MLEELTRKMATLVEPVAGQENVALDYLCLPGSEEGGTATFLAFGRGQEPLYVAKVHRSADAERRSRAEAQLLGYLADHALPPSIVVPRVLMIDQLAGHWVFVQSVVPGRQIEVRVARDNVPRLSGARRGFAHACRALEAFAAVSSQGPAPGVDGLLDEARRVLDLSRSEQAVLDWLEEKAPEYNTSPARIRHGDFTRHNILVHGNRSRTPIVSVIDWTEGALAASPLHDLFFFATTFYLQRRRIMGRAGFLHAFESTFVRSNPYQSFVAETIEHHALTTGIRREAIPWLFGVFLIDRAVAERRVSDQSRQPPFWQWFLHAAATEKSWPIAVSGS